MPTKPLSRLALCSLILLVAAIFIGGAQPGVDHLFPPPLDKLVHITAYGAMAIFAGLALPARPLPVVILLIAFIGGADEIHQIYLPGRDPGMDDWLADIVGTLLATPLLVKARLLLRGELL